MSSDETEFLRAREHELAGATQLVVETLAALDYPQLDATAESWSLSVNGFTVDVTVNWDDTDGPVVRFDRTLVDYFPKRRTARVLVAVNDLNLGYAELKFLVCAGMVFAGFAVPAEYLSVVVARHALASLARLDVVAGVLTEQFAEPLTTLRALD